MAKKAKKPTASKWEHFSDDPKVQAHYEACREAGSDIAMSELLAGRKAPRVMDTYSPMHPRRGRGNNGAGRGRGA